MTSRIWIGSLMATRLLEDPGVDGAAVGLELGSAEDEGDLASGYFYNGLFKNHYGALRSEAALKILVETLSN